MLKLVPYVVIAFTLRILLVESNNVHDCLWILLLFLLGYAILLKRTLPFFWKTL